MKKLVSLLSVALLATAFASGCSGKWATCKEANDAGKDVAAKKANCVEDKVSEVCKIDGDDCVKVEDTEMDACKALTPADKDGCKPENKGNVECTFKETKKGGCEAKLVWAKP